MSIDKFSDFHAFTLEPPFKEDGSKPRAIPAGTYQVTLRYSPKHNMDVPHVENVPGFDEIEIHPGNFPRDTLGCCLVGQTKDIDFIGASRPVFMVVLNRVKNAILQNEPIQIVYIDNR